MLLRPYFVGFLRTDIYFRFVGFVFYHVWVLSIVAVASVINQYRNLCLIQSCSRTDSRFFQMSAEYQTSSSSIKKKGPLASGMDGNGLTYIKKKKKKCVKALFLAQCLISASLCSLALFHTSALAKRLPSDEEKVGFKRTMVLFHCAPEACTVAICCVSRLLHCLHWEAGGTLAASQPPSQLRMKPGMKSKEMITFLPSNNNTR